ncbi:MAG: transporter [Thiohalocapsa sp.]|jgi:hypothetical protein
MRQTGHPAHTDPTQTEAVQGRHSRAGALSTAFAAAALLSAAPALATEGGGSHYPNGAEDFMVGALPPPGNYFINYLNWYSADSFRNDDGGRLFDDFNLDVVANTFRFIHVTKHKVFGASWALHAFVPLVNVDVERRIAPPFADESDDRFGLGDIIIDPFILGWHGQNWHITTGLDIYLPTGAYDEDRLANPGRNYWTFQPIFAFTYLSPQGFEASAKLMYDFSTENDATDYQSGQAFHADYTLGYHTGPWSLGVGGYYYQQTTNDELNGETFLDGFKGRTFAVGPQVKYSHQKMAVTVKYLAETAVENRPEGGGLWVKFQYAF